MATNTRTLVRLASRSARAAAPTRSQLLRQPLRTSRGYSTGIPPKPASTGAYWGVGAAALAGAGGYYFYNHSKTSSEINAVPKIFKPTQADYQKVYDMIAKRLDEREDYDDGSFGPVLVRLAWHASGTYDKETGTGGSNGATMRFPPEGDHGANAGLTAARDFLGPVKEAFPWITFSDLWTLGGVAAIQEMQGPVIPWRPGRTDRDVSFCTPDGRLPDGSKEQSHLRAIFGRMGFNDQEIVALSGAHALGRCHTDRSGFEGPWTFSPTVFTNDYFRLLMEEKWAYKKWNGPKQFEDVTTKSLMMLPTDMALIKDKEFKKHVERYAKDEEAFFKDFSNVFTRLLELGVPFESKEEDRIAFKPTVEA